MKNNQVTIKGKVLSVAEFGKMVYIHLFVKNGDAVNFPSVTCTTEEMKTAAKKLQKEDNVVITGRIGLRPKEVQVSGEKKRVYQNNIIAENISVQDPFAENGTGGRLFGDDCAEFIGKCKILFIKKVADNTVIINASDGTRHINLTRFTKNPDAFIEKYPVDTEILVKASIQTQRKENVDGKKYFVNVIITDIRKVG